MTTTDPDAVRHLMVRLFTADELRHIAANMEASDPRQVARRKLSPEARDELATMLADGRKPTIGWWRRHG